MKMGDNTEDFKGTGGPDSSRREFLAAGLAAGVVGAVPALAASQASAAVAGGIFLLTNILLETGYAREGGEVIGTLTVLSAILVQDGEIARIMTVDEPAPAGVAVMDGEGMLLLPSFRDMHIHLDKTFYGWRDEYAISQSLKIATAGLTPLDAAGTQTWPKAGDAADMVLVPASSAAEAVAHLPERKVVFHKGNIASRYDVRIESAHAHLTTAGFDSPI